MTPPLRPVDNWNQKAVSSCSWINKPQGIKSGSLWNTHKINPVDILNLSEKKQKDLGENSLHKKAVIYNTIKEMKKKEEVWRGS